jgi:hypothetical protein
VRALSALVLPVTIVACCGFLGAWIWKSQAEIGDPLRRLRIWRQARAGVTWIDGEYEKLLSREAGNPR